MSEMDVFYLVQTVICLLSLCLVRINTDIADNDIPDVKTTVAQVHESHMDGGRRIDLPYADWGEIAREELYRAERVTQPRVRPARNVIVIIGDGLGVSTVTAARYLKAQREAVLPHEVKLSWDKFPYTGLSKTYNSDVLTGDSAAGATAILTGEKVRYGTLGVTDSVERYNCDKYSEETQLKSIFKHAIDNGMWAGVVTNTRLTDATPASAYASTPDRKWEASVPEECKDKVKDIAYQMIHDKYAKQFRVLLGGGRKKFIPDTVVDVEDPTVTGDRKDGRDLVQDWICQKSEFGIPEHRHTYVNDRANFERINPMFTDYLLGIFEADHMNYEADRTNDTFGEPSLLEMTEKAIKILERSENGYLLLVEGGRIDSAHHTNLARRALEETLMLEKTVTRVTEMTDPDETLIIVTGDHSHVFTLGGKTRVGSNIFGWVVDQDGEKRFAKDGKPEMFLRYSDGPGWKFHRSTSGEFSHERLRKNVSVLLESGDTGSLDFVYDGPIPKRGDSHGAEDVPIYAQGPMSHLLTGTHEQMYIAHIAMYAACIGPYHTRDHCSQLGKLNSRSDSAFTQPPLSLNLYLLILITAVRTAFFNVT